MASSDPKQGGDLFDMAKDGTSIPGDAGKQNLIPSVPRPDQIATENETGAINYGGAADNATDISRVRSNHLVPSTLILSDKVYAHDLIFLLSPITLHSLT